VKEKILGQISSCRTSGNQYTSFPLRSVALYRR
jgi:hypothetical protein